MSNYDKISYNTLYNKNNRKPLNIGLSNIEHESLIAFCQQIDVKPAFYLKALVNADLIQRGFKPIFIDGRTHKVVLLSTDTQNQVDNKNV